SALNMLFQSEMSEGQVRKPKLDGSKLPDYAVVRKYLGLGGAEMHSEADGWMILGFTLNPGAAQQAARPAQPR
ncbi:MAG TPA: hypothetical protein VG713_20020, partial [Pirellulales bacterium]|nr:hypothetical protein [Pirellulales bacterium]